MIDLKEIIAPVFYDIYRSFKKNDYTYYWLKGGRSSTKSSFISIAILMGIMKDVNANACVFMKTANNLRQHVFEQFKWAINTLGVNYYFKFNLSPLKITYIPTGQIILFKGLDDSGKTKSIKVAKGYFKLLWFEELSEFSSWEEIRITLLSLLRKSDENINAKFSVFMSYNPPKNPNNWVNIESQVKREDRLVHHSTYLDVPKKWLTEATLKEAETLKILNEKAYRHEFLGEITGVEGLVYPMFNRKVHIINNLKEIPQNNTIYKIICGIDGGTINDSTTLVPFCLLSNGTILIAPTFCYNPKEIGHQPLATTDQVALMVNHLNYLGNEVLKDLLNKNSVDVLIVVDSASQDIKLEFYKTAYYNAVAVPKKDIIVDMRRLQSMLSTPNLIKILNLGYFDPLNGLKLKDDDMLITELENLVVDSKSGKPMDGNDHSIDAAKYGSYFIYNSL